MSDNWETLSRTEYSHTSRLKVFGGWIVREQSSSRINGVDCFLVFVPDISHEWRI